MSSSSSSRLGYSTERIVIGVAVLLIVMFNIQLSGSIVHIDMIPDHQALLPVKTQSNKQQSQIPFSTPIFIVGLPKVGTSSIHAMFACSGIRSSHYCCCGSNRTHTHCNDGGRSFSECMRENMKSQRPILEGCGNYDVYAQMDAELGNSKSKV
jgi:hypothetical protein